MITLDTSGPRFVHANHALSSAVGFEVRPFTPLDAQTDPRVLRMEQQYLRNNETFNICSSMTLVLCYFHYVCPSVSMTRM